MGLGATLGPVDLDGYAFVAHFRMHRIGKIDRRGIARQLDDLALGCKDVDLARVEIHLDVLHELHGIGGTVLHVHQA